MFREMRRSKQLLSNEDTASVLNRCTSGVLAVHGDDGYPYAVPLSYVFHDDKIYFHCASTGHKLDAILKNEKVSFCVTDQDQIVSEKYTTLFRSVIVFGRASIVEENEEKHAALMALAVKYSGDQPEASHHKEIDSAWSRVRIVRIDIDHMTGKEAIELVNMKKG